MGRRRPAMIRSQETCPHGGVGPSREGGAPWEGKKFSAQGHPRKVRPLAAPPRAHWIRLEEVDVARKAPFGRSLLLFSVALVLASCARGGQPTGAVPSYPLSFRDNLGREVQVPREPSRVVSLAPSVTEVIFAVGGGGKLVGVDRFSDFPPEAQKIEKIGGFSDPSLEKIASLKPDLVIGTAMHKKFLPQLESLGIPVVLLEPGSIEDVEENIRLVGRILGLVKGGEEAAKRLESRVGAVRKKVSGIPEARRPLVYYEVYSEPLMSAGPGTFISRVIEAAGGRNAFADASTDWPEVSPEAVVAKDPDVIIYPSVHGSASVSAEKIRGRPGWNRIKAVREGRIYSIDADIISRPGPRLAEAVEEVARILHPDIFGTPRPAKSLPRREGRVPVAARPI